MTNDYYELIVKFAERFIAELNEPDNYRAFAMSDGTYKYLNITDVKNHETITTISARTWRALFESVRDAWTLHCMAKRGF